MIDVDVLLWCNSTKMAQLPHVTGQVMNVPVWLAECRKTGLVRPHVWNVLVRRACWNNSASIINGFLHCTLLCRCCCCTAIISTLLLLLLLLRLPLFPPSLSESSKDLVTSIGEYSAKAASGSQVGKEPVDDAALPQKRKRKTCSVTGCNFYARARGVCYKHGSVRQTRRLCCMPGCKSQAYTKACGMSHQRA